MLAVVRLSAALLTAAALTLLAPGAPARADEARAFTSGGLTRTYQLHLPAGGGRPSALVVALHGSGSSGRDFAATTRWGAVADAHGAAVVFPDGVDLSWADGRGASLPDRQGVDDVGFLSALTAATVADLGIAPGRVFVTGMSAGGFMASRLACDRADQFAAAAPVAATLGAGVPCAPSRPVSVLAVHGTADPVVPYGGGSMVGRGGASTIVSAPELADRWRSIDGCPGPGVRDVFAAGGTTTTRTVAAPCADGTEVRTLAVAGGGHTWPGAAGNLPRGEVGAPITAFDGAQTAWEFFAAHGR